MKHTQGETARKDIAPTRLMITGCRCRRIVNVFGAALQGTSEQAQRETGGGGERAKNKERKKYQ